MKAKYLFTAGLGIAAITAQVRASEILANGNFTGSFNGLHTKSKSQNNQPRASQSLLTDNR